MVNVNSFAVKFRVVDVSGAPVPSLLVVGPDPDVPLDLKANETALVAVTVTNGNNGAFRIIDAVPRLQSGEPVLSSATASFDVPVGETPAEIVVTARADARVGDEGDYLIDLVAEAA